MRFLLLTACLLAALSGAASFTRVATAPRFGIQTPTRLLDASNGLADALVTSVATSENDCSTKEQDSSNMSIRAPLKFMGPYPAMGLRFPKLSTASQRLRNVTGISLDFVLDTAANTNTINAQVAQELQLEKVGSALPGVSAAGFMDGSDTFLLGEAALEGVSGSLVVPRDGSVLDHEETGDEMQKEEPFVFMQNLTAASLPIASPASAGLLSLAFFHTFQGGVEFAWGNPTKGIVPSVTFHGAVNPMLQETLGDLTRVRVDPIPITQLPSVMVTVNGVTMPALLDTGSPVSVLNTIAAQQAGVDTVELPHQHDYDKKKNPFAKLANQFQQAQAMAQAASKGDVLTLAGANGQQPTYLAKSRAAPQVAVVGADGDDQVVSFGDQTLVYVGNLPGLAALNGLGVDSPPAMVLGMDLLRQRPKMVLRARQKELYL